MNPGTTVSPATVSPGTTAGPGEGSPADGRGSRWRRLRWPAFVVTGMVLAAVVSAALLPETNRGSLDPRSAEPDGSRAVAQVLRGRGVKVDVVQRSTDAVDGATRRTTIVVVSPSLLGPVQLQRLSRSSADLVLVEPDLVVLRELAPAVTPLGSADASRVEDPACADPDATAAGPVTGGGQLYARAAGAPPGTTFTGCYPGRRSGTAGKSSDRYSMVRVADDGRRVTVLGQRQLLQNEFVEVDGNAALALRTLGAHPELRWYLPDPTELGETAEVTVGDLLPPWVRWATFQLGVVALLAMLWRGRRLGGVVAEPLPVVVRSAETAEGRARLYRAGRARGHAASILRTASTRRLAARLGVPSEASPSDVAHLAAEAAGADPGRVAQLLLGAPPRDDAALVTLSTALDDLERAVAEPGGATPRYGDAAKDPEHRPDPEGGR